MTRAEEWRAAYERLLTHARSLGRVPHLSERDSEGRATGLWAGKQRRRGRCGELVATQRAQLEIVPGWRWEPPPGRRRPYAEMFEGLRRHVDEHGHACVPMRYVTATGLRLGDLVMNVRSEQRQGKLPAHLAAQFEALPGWRWDVRAPQS